MLNIDPTTILFQIINFLVLFALLYFLLFKNLIKRADKRKSELEAILAKTQANYRDSESLRRQLEDTLENIHQEVAEYISKAKAELEIDRYQVLEETKVKAEQIIKQAQSNASTIQSLAIAETQNKMLDLIIEIVGNIINNSAPAEFHESLVKQINDRVWEMGKKEMREVDMIRKSLEEREPTLTVRTPKPLSKEQQSSIVRTFSALADKNIKLQISRDSSLISGLRIRLGDFIIDNSLKAKLQEIKAEALEDVGERLQDLKNG